MTNNSYFKPIAILATFTMALTINGCGSSNNSDTASPSIEQNTTNLGEVYTDKDGMTLYTFNKDTANTSNCNDGCAAKWPPLLANNDALAEGRFSIITRADNSKQWALDSWPLYRWINDNVSGDTTGEGIKNVWFVAQPTPTSKSNTEVTSNGTTNKVTVLTDNARMTLYTFTNDKNKSGGSACNGDCATAWPPLLTDDNATANGDYSLITRDDGTKQWAYYGMPLYRWKNDASMGDTTGEGIKNIWFVAQAVPVSKYNTTDQGLVLSDNNRLTLYVLDNETKSNLVCKGPCLTAWPPLLAKETDINRDDYTTFTNANGVKQWAYKDQPLYRWKGDANADDTNGQGLAHSSGGTWVVAKP